MNGSFCTTIPRCATPIGTWTTNRIGQGALHAHSCLRNKYSVPQVLETEPFPRRGERLHNSGCVRTHDSVAQKSNTPQRENF